MQFSPLQLFHRSFSSSFFSTEYLILKCFSGACVLGFRLQSSFFFKLIKYFRVRTVLHWIKCTRVPSYTIIVFWYVFGFKMFSLPLCLCRSYFCCVGICSRALIWVVLFVKAFFKWKYSLSDSLSICHTVK